VGNVRSYFSGHYQAYGCNVQAACDSHLRFSFTGLAGPGVMPDRDALKECALHELIESLPLGYVAIGDAAYMAIENLASIYYGDAGKIPKYDNYNYFASQCRI
jgi:DDE superfamily endonuclease